MNMPTWELLGQFGFPALLVFVLLFIGRQELHSLRQQMKDTTDAIDRCAEASNMLVLAMAWLPEAFKQKGENLKQRIHDAQQGRKEDN